MAGNNAAAVSPTASSSQQQQGSHKEYIVRVPKSNRKRYHMMRFSADLGADFFKTWTQCKMERENNLKEYRAEEEMPKFGAGSEFGREQREEARRKRFGINVKQYKSEDQPWMLNVGGKNGKKFKGIREGGVGENVSWYVFMQGKDGAFEAYPVDEWYNFQPIQRYKALSAEEAEEEFIRRDKIMNYFQVMYEKKFRKDGKDYDDEEGGGGGGGGKKKGSKKSLMLSEMDDWVSDDEDEGEDKNEDESDNDEGEKKKKKKKHLIRTKKNQGGKKKKEEGESDDSCMEESDEYNEGAEHDYISSDSSDSDQQNEEVVGKELAGVEEGDALKKLLASDEDEDEEAEKDKEEEEEKKEEETEDKEKKKKKKKKKDKKSDKDSDESSGSSEDEGNKKKREGSHVPSERKKAVNELKRKVKENPHEMNPHSKKTKLDHSGPSSSNLAASSGSDSMEEAIKRYLMRKPMTTTELLKNFKKKKDLSSEQLVTTIAQILKRVNPVKRVIKGKMYLSLKST